MTFKKIIKNYFLARRFLARFASCFILARLALFPPIKITLYD